MAFRLRLPFRAALVAAGALAVSTSLHAPAPRAQETPQAAQPSRRVTGQDAAQGAEVVLNQIDSARFPKVTLFATVLREGKPVRGLAAADFRVREDEVDQAPLTVEPRLVPLYTVVTLDTSGSMRPRLAEAKAAAQAFVDSLGTGDRVRALSFAREVKALNGPGADRASAKTGLAGTTARGDTALYDALYASVELSRDQPGRKAVVLLSDGVDDDGTGKPLSKRTLAEALALAKSVNVPVYTIGLGTEIDDGILGRVAEETGGQYHKAPEASQLRELYARIGEQLSGQYTISYTSDLAADGAERRVSLGAAGATGTKAYRAPQGAASTAQADAQASAQAAPAPKPAAPADDRVKGGTSFETATSIEPGRAYRLRDHLRQGEYAYFSFQAQGGQTVTASVQTGPKGVAISDTGSVSENPRPHAGLMVTGPDRSIIGERHDIIGSPLKKESVQIRVLPGRGGTFYLVTGASYGAEHRDTTLSVEVSGEPEEAASRPATPASTGPVQRVAGGTSFETAVPLDLGKTYRLKEHLRNREIAYFAFEVPAGRTLPASVHTGTRGVAISDTGSVSENPQPHAGLALASADRSMIGQRHDIIGAPLKRAGGQVRLAGDRGGKVYVLIGAQYGAVHRDTDFTVSLAGGDEIPGE